MPEWSFKGTVKMLIRLDRSPGLSESDSLRSPCGARATLHHVSFVLSRLNLFFAASEVSLRDTDYTETTKATENNKRY